MINQSRNTKPLSETNPELAAEWHPTKNGTLKPSMIRAGSSRVVWWLGKCGHEWPTRVVHRKNGIGCPYCSNQKVLVGFNDLQTKFPDIAAEWHPTKNIDLKPTMVVWSSNKKVWWLGNCGHEWQAAISPRTRLGVGCRQCYHEGQTSFAEQAIFYYLSNYFPDTTNRNTDAIEMELDIYIPSLKIAIEYDGKHFHKNRKTDISKNAACKKADILLIRILEQGLTPFEDCYCIFRENDRSNDDLSNSIRQVIRDIDSHIDVDVDVTRDEPSIREMYISRKKQNSVATLFPEIAKEWHPTKNGFLTPDKVISGSMQSAWWLGKCGHEWPARVAHRTKGSGCPYCSGTKVLSGFNDLQTKFPDTAAKWHPVKNGNLLPSMVSAGAKEKVWWLDRCGHEWQRSISAMTGRSSACPFCQQASKVSKHISQSKTEANEYNVRIRPDNTQHFVPRYNVLVGFNDFKTEHPDIAVEWHPIKNGDLKPSMFTSGSGKKVWWRGKCGHEWQRTIVQRVNSQACPYCTNREVLIGFNDIATTHPLFAEEWHPTKNGEIKPTMLTANSGKEVWWLCNCGHEWKSRVIDRTQGTMHCQNCSSNKLTRCIVCVETGRIFSSMLEAQNSTGINDSLIAECCKGRKETAGGYHWKYVEKCM